MGLLDKIKNLATQQQITIAELERRIGLSNGQIRKWANQTPGIDKVQLVADYFNVSIDFLLGRTESKNEQFEQPMSKQVMMRMNTEGLSEIEIDEIEQEMERFFAWRIEEIKRERDE